MVKKLKKFPGRNTPAAFNIRLVGDRRHTRGREAESQDRKQRLASAHRANLQPARQ
jgi:hypothetical protein